MNAIRKLIAFVVLAVAATGASAALCTFNTVGDLCNLEWDATAVPAPRTIISGQIGTVGAAGASFAW
ncbi:MAG: hypothetical protein KJZ83_19865 [Burkholderiaceae bacterium]|nr:hypothetical protein [Burkholderiaceae bacterium]